MIRRRSKRPPSPCPGCGRERSTCWTMPCLHLERVRHLGAVAIANWIRDGLPPGVVITVGAAS